MSADFSQPQRQSVIGVLVMFFYTLQQYARALWPVMVVWLFKFDEVNKLYFFLGIFATFIIIGIVSFLQYLNFTFFLDKENEEFIISEGVFNKTITTIQLNKIQQVNINQSLLQKLVGVYELAVDTAGSNKKEGAIKAISHELALELKFRLLENEKKIKTLISESNAAGINSEVEEKAADTYDVIKISFLSLLKVGITSNYLKSISLLLIFFFTVSDYLNKITGRDLIHDENIEDYVDENLVMQTFLVFTLFLFAVVLLINIVRVVFRYFDYKITRQKGSLLLSFGLLNTKNTIIKPEKVQITSVSRNYFQKKMNILELKIKQATGGSVEEQKSVIEIPGCNEQERDEILKLLFHKLPEKGVVMEPNFRKLGFSVFLTIGLPLFLVYLFRSYIELQGVNLSLGVFVYIVFVGLIQYFIFRNNRLYVNDDFIIKQSGAWDIKNEIIEPGKIQAITTSQLFWHKSADIGSVTLHTAGGNIAFQLGNFTKIKEYVNLWLYEIETSDSNWM
jgi:putative membrane protein